MNYPSLQQGDRLPQVGVLQKLLNRTGANLLSDGIFGSHTVASVKVFQTQRKLTADGVVGSLTWQHLTYGVNLPILDSIDVFDPTFYLENTNYICSEYGNHLLNGETCKGVAQALCKIL